MYLGAVEVCDGVDNDCDEAVDELFDLDGDGVMADDPGLRGALRRGRLRRPGYRRPASSPHLLRTEDSPPRRPIPAAGAATSAAGSEGTDDLDGSPRIEYILRAGNGGSTPDGSSAWDVRGFGGLVCDDGATGEFR